ncbi:hypothetical protein KJ780_02395 [Candidatus Micrarchaeota archaeon]|nr:hypothetical protein [Candidatus Micrarchaeota archaeon]
MLNIFKKIKKKNRIICGGEYCAEILQKGKTVGKIYYRQPDYDEVLTFVYENEFLLTTSDEIKAISKMDNKDKIPGMHKKIDKDIFRRFGEKIFIRSEGFCDKNETPLEELNPEEQFVIIAKYYSHCIQEIVSKAYAVETSVKKKSLQ